MAVKPIPDDPHIERISSALWSHRSSGSAALLVGAGFSKNAIPVGPNKGSMPGWNEIYESMVEALYPEHSSSKDGRDRSWLLKQTGATSAYLRVAEEFEAYFGRGALDKLILKNVPDNRFAPGALHELLVELPWSDILTTNWDTLLERAAKGAEERVYDILRSPAEVPETRAPRIVKLHGSIPSDRPFIFTEEDFRTYPVHSAAFINLAQQVAMENTLVLLGFSGDDPNFLYWTGWVRDRLGAKAPTIYLVGALDLSASKRRMLENRNVQPIDLAKLPQFENWPKPIRVQNANQWFIERLRSGEPYIASRWPKPNLGFVPKLELITPPSKPNLPEDVPSYEHTKDKLEVARSMTAHWSHNRPIHPGWIVAPMKTWDWIWKGLSHRLADLIIGIRKMPPQERLASLFELNWLLEIALVPLELTIDDLVVEVLEELRPKISKLGSVSVDQYMALTLAMARHCREEGKGNDFQKHIDWLTTATRGNRLMEDRLVYERCLWYRSRLQISKLETMVDGWSTDGDTRWMLCKAGLLADLGRMAEADALSATALNDIRSQTRQNENDIPSWSRESFALLFRAASLDGWEANALSKGRFDVRQELLQSRGCPGRSDYSTLVEKLSQKRPPSKRFREVNRMFDVGFINTKHNLGGSDPREQLLLAYQGIRFREDSGLPVRTGMTGLMNSVLVGAASWLIDIAPQRALNALCDAAPSATSDQLNDLLTRAAVAKLDKKIAARTLTNLINLIPEARKRIKGDDALFWTDRFKFALEVASRLVLRVPGSTPKLFDTLIETAGDPEFVARWRIGKEVNNVFRRSFEAAKDSEHPRMLLALFKIAMHSATNPSMSDTIDVTGLASRVDSALEFDAEWSALIEVALGGMLDHDLRLEATSRLHWFEKQGLLNEAAKKRWASLLWSDEFMENGLPSNTCFLPTAFLALPSSKSQEELDVLVKTFLFKEKPLDDEEVEVGGLVEAYHERDGLLDAGIIQREIDRLREFVEHHSPAPKHMELFGMQRTGMVINCSLMAAALAGQVSCWPELHDPIASLLAIDRYPLRIEPSIPAMTKLELITIPDAMKVIEDLNREDSDEARQFRSHVFYMVRTTQDLPSEFLKRYWNEIAELLKSRRPLTLNGVLAGLMEAYGSQKTMVPEHLDGIVCKELGFLLDETRMTLANEDLDYDPFAVRISAAGLFTTMNRLGKCNKKLAESWNKAIDEDPLPDTRRARSSQQRRAIRDIDAEADAD